MASYHESAWADTPPDNGDVDHGWEVDYRISSPRSFLNLPREIRDIIYRHLLSTKYTKEYIGDPQIGSLNRDYKNRLYPSVLRTNRQIEREASYVLYTENCLIRVNSCGQSISANAFGPGVACYGKAVSVLARDEEAQRFTRHTLDIVMLREGMPQEESWFEFVENCYVIAGDDLPRLCHTMLLEEVLGLEDLTLAIEIYSDHTAALAAKCERDLTINHGEGVVRGNASTENSISTEDDKTMIRKNPSIEKATSEERDIREYQPIDLDNETRSAIGTPRVLRLLESLRKLHSLYGVHIVGSISDDQKTSLLISMLGPPPSELELFDQLLHQFEDARITHGKGDQDGALTKMKSTLDTVKDQIRLRHHDWDGSTVIPAGPYIGYTVHDAQWDIMTEVWIELGWAYLQGGDEEEIWHAYCYVELIIGQPKEQDPYWKSPPMGHKGAMVFHLAAHAAAAQGDLLDHSRSYYLPWIMEYLNEGLRHEPGNSILARELRERKAELEELDDLMEMWERLNGESEIDQEE